MPDNQKRLYLTTDLAVVISTNFYFTIRYRRYTLIVLWCVTLSESALCELVSIARA